MAKYSFISVWHHPTDLLELVPYDVCDLINQSVIGVFNTLLFLSMICQDTSMCLIKYKSKPFEMFKGFQLEVEKPTAICIKYLWLDRSDKFINSEFAEYLKENEILA